ncbi:MAG TPA: molybdate ABC transporter substrate-binding protein [Burkholderiaceae bacterium]|nr:molybdate ABC transporter substrate-binding protein [Burkholderiaceae bacterium]
MRASWCRRQALRWAVALAGLACVMAVRAQAPITVFAAASLADVLEDARREWQATGASAVRMSFAASSTLARQIESGAPADVFISADEQWVDYLAQRAFVVPGSRRVVAGNRLVFIASARASAAQRAFRCEPGFDLVALLGRGRLVVGDPAHVPVGRYAQQALTALGAWPVAQSRLVPADNTRAALALVERGEVPLGIVYATDAAHSREVVVACAIAPEHHAPIVYPMVLIARGASVSPEARAFAQWLAGPRGREIFLRHGFTAP